MKDRICTIEGCDRVILCRGWCRPHYRRWSDYGDPEYVKPPAVVAPCSIDGCPSDSHAKGWCKSHYERWRRTGDPEWTKPIAQSSVCAVDGCNRPAKSRGWCQAHYFRWRRTGDPDPGRPLLLKGLPPEQCNIEGCDRDQNGLGLCELHARRYRKWGDPYYVEEKARRGVFSHWWSGDDVGYAGAHDRVRTRRGKVQQYACIDCGGQAKHWSYDHEDPDEKRGVEYGLLVAYSIKVEHYHPRCVPCHKRFDLDHIDAAAGF